MFLIICSGELMVNVICLVGQDGWVLNVIDFVDFIEVEVWGCFQVRDYICFFNNFMLGCENVYVVDIGVEVGICQICFIVGVEMLGNEDVVSCCKRDDGICWVLWLIELYNGEKLKLYWFLDDYYEVFYGVLFFEIGENIIVVGCCLSVEYEVLVLVCVIVQCFEYGYVVVIVVVYFLNMDVLL